MNPNNRMFIRNIRNIVAIFSIGRIFFTSFQYILMKQEIQINMHSLSLTLTFVLIWNLEAVIWYLRMLFRTLNCHLNVGLNELYEFNTVRSLYLMWMRKRASCTWFKKWKNRLMSMRQRLFWENEFFSAFLVRFFKENLSKLWHDLKKKHAKIEQNLKIKKISTFLR